MPSMSPEERAEFVDLVAQAVIDKLDERERVQRLADLVVARVLALQAEEARLQVREDPKDDIGA